MPRVSRRALTIVLVGASALAAAVLWLTPRGGPRSGGAAVPPGAATVPEIAGASTSAPPVIFVGLDGADWELLDRLVADGSMPELARLLREGASGVLETQHPPLSPLVWTSMMTGLSPLDHTILDFTRFNPATGTKEPITSDERREPAVWNMASWAGRRVLSVGLWATYPAEPVNGTLVSDRLFSFLYKEDQPPPGIVYPLAAEEAARAILRKAESEIDLAELREYLPWLDDKEYATRRDAAEPYAHPVSALRRILVETRVYDAIATEALRRDKPDLAILYVQGTDSIGHVFAPFAPPRQPEVSPEEFERYQGVPVRYFRYVDELLGRYRALADTSGAVLMLASDHGFTWGEGRPTRLSSFAHATAAKWHRKSGMYLLRGPGVAASNSTAHPHKGTVAQVAATLLALSGLPPGKRLAWPPLPPLPEPDAARVDYHTPYRRPTAVAAAAPAGADAEAIEKLRALGYIGAGETASAPEAARRSGSTRTAGSYNNEALLLQADGKRERAVAAFEKALEIDPNLASAAWNLSDLLHGEKRELDRSDALLVTAFAHGLPDGTKLLVGRAIGYQRGGDGERSLRLMQQASVAQADEPEVWLFLGRYQVGAGRCSEAVPSFQKATSLAPENPAAFASLGLAQMCAGDSAGAEAALRKSLALDPDQPRVRAFLAKVSRS
ncbi:MAG TPA: alkaline phosphatase family protein [Vicinamibacteria bacterium]